MAASTAAALAVPAREVAVTGARAGSVVVDMRVNAADAGAAARPTRSSIRTCRPS